MNPPPSLLLPPSSLSSSSLLPGVGPAASMAMTSLLGSEVMNKLESKEKEVVGATLSLLLSKLPQPTTQPPIRY